MFRCNLPPALWQNNWSLLCATAVTRGWNGHRIGVSTQSLLWRRKFSCHSCWDSNSQPFDHQSGDLSRSYSWTQMENRLQCINKVIKKQKHFIRLSHLYRHTYIYHTSELENSPTPAFSYNKAILKTPKHLARRGFHCTCNCHLNMLVVYSCVLCQEKPRQRQIYKNPAPFPNPTFLPPGNMFFSSGRTQYQLSLLTLQDLVLHYHFHALFFVRTYRFIYLSNC